MAFLGLCALAFGRVGRRVCTPRGSAATLPIKRCLLERGVADNFIFAFVVRPPLAPALIVSLLILYYIHPHRRSSRGDATRSKSDFA